MDGRRKTNLNKHITCKDTTRVVRNRAGPKFYIDPEYGGNKIRMSVIENGVIIENIFVSKLTQVPEYIAKYSIERLYTPYEMQSATFIEALKQVQDDDSCTLSNGLLY